MTTSYRPRPTDFDDLAGLAPTTEVMLAARLLTGVGAAMIMPATLAVITSSFPARSPSGSGWDSR